LIPNYKNADQGKKVVENKHDWVYKAPEQADDFAGFKLRLWQALCPLAFPQPANQFCGSKTCSL
jgi:hypothetical protein